MAFAAIGPSRRTSRGRRPRARPWSRGCPCPRRRRSSIPASAVQVHAGATSATGNTSLTLAARHRTGPEVGHHDRVGRRQPRDRRARQRLGDRQVGDRLRGHGHGRRVVRQVRVRLIVGGDGRRVGDRARLRDARRDRQSRAAGVRDRPDRPEASRRVVRALRRGRRVEREPRRQHLGERDARRRTRALVVTVTLNVRSSPTWGDERVSDLVTVRLADSAALSVTLALLLARIRIQFRLLRDRRGVDQGARRRDRRDDRQRGRRPAPSR